MVVGPLLPGMKTRALIQESFTTTSHDVRLYTDASSTFAFGAIYGRRWLQHAWTPSQRNKMSIDCMELFAIVAAVMTFGREWEGKRIVIMTDNLPITQIWQSGSTPTKTLMLLIRRLYLFAAQNGFSIALKHIFGKYNRIADAISQFQMATFRRLVPDSETLPKPLAPSVMETLEQVTKIC